MADPAVTRRAKDLLKKGYAKLTGYECPKKGYEWFGGDPGHEALTAYGLMEFRDMAEVYDVDPEMIQPDRRVAAGPPRRQGRLPAEPQGPGQLRRRAAGDHQRLHHLGPVRVGPGGDRGRDRSTSLELADEVGRSVPDRPGRRQRAQRRQARTTADKLLDKLAKAQADDGHLEGTQGSITRSGGQSLKVETTALAALAWLKLPAVRRRRPTRPSSGSSTAGRAPAASARPRPRSWP